MTAKRFFVIVAACFGVVVLSWVALIGAVYAWGGVATVRVSEQHEGMNLYLPVPMALVDAAVVTSTVLVPQDDWLQLGVELGEFGPMVRALLKELDECPDVTLVEVEDGRQRVRVYKRSGALKVEVEEEDLSVRVSIPTRSARRTISRLTRMV